MKTGTTGPIGPFGPMGPPPPLSPLGPCCLPAASSGTYAFLSSFLFVSPSSITSLSSLGGSSAPALGPLPPIITSLSSSFGVVGSSNVMGIPYTSLTHIRLFLE